MSLARFRHAALLTLTTLLGCAFDGDTAGSESAIVDPNDSNIRSPELGTVTELKVLPNTHVPRAVLVQLTFSDFAGALYDHILQINQSEHLTGVDGPAQQINLIAVGRTNQFAELVSTLRRRHPSGVLPLLSHLDGVSSSDVWMQDFGEFAAVRGTKNPAQKWYGLLDAGRDRGTDVGALGQKLGISITRIDASQYGSAGNYGGNTEATAEGKLYVGDDASPAFIARLKSLGNADAITLPSKWLKIGHVDEYVNVVPAKNDCHSAFMVSSPLEALNIARRSPAEFTYFHRNLDAALDGYALTKRPAGEDYVFEDFDLARRPVGVAQEFVRVNLESERAIRDAIARLQAAACVSVVRLPQLYTHLAGKAIAAFPNTVNSLVLRNHVVVPDPRFESIRRITIERYGQALGSASNVHLIDDEPYFRQQGDVHCATNVIREPDLQYRP